MAIRGRKPKPTALKMLEGNPGKHPLNEHEPVPPKSTIKCPAWLEPEAKKEWKRLAPSLEAMGILTSVDITEIDNVKFLKDIAFEAFCAYTNTSGCISALSVKVKSAGLYSVA